MGKYQNFLSMTSARPISNSSPAERASISWTFLTGCQTAWMQQCLRVTPFMALVSTRFVSQTSNDNEASFTKLRAQRLWTEVKWSAVSSYIMINNSNGRGKALIKIQDECDFCYQSMMKKLKILISFNDHLDYITEIILSMMFSLWNLYVGFCLWHDAPMVCGAQSSREALKYARSIFLGSCWAQVEGICSPTVVHRASDMR